MKIKKESIKNQKGQMAIFIALIFQILFVFFAMVVNIGLLVHDKINLQNSIDLAVYYGAQKQAEMLNAIAHINYQIRQSWKLLAFRYRVTGAMGYSSHPIQIMTKTKNLAFPDAIVENYPVAPAVCVTHYWWKKYGEKKPNENLCKSKGIFIPQIPKVPVIAGFLGWNPALTAYQNKLRESFKDACSGTGLINWTWAAGIMFNYKQDQANRKMLIQSLAEKLSENVHDLYDLDGQSVLAGMRKTLEKNLTSANLDSLSEVEIFNSLAHPDLGSSAKERVKKWLPTIDIAPTLYYVTENSAGSGSSGSAGCDLTNPVIPITNTFNGANSKEAEALVPYMSEPPLDDPIHSSLGVEKNPWAMIYVGMKVKTAPRKPFAPFGVPVALIAKSFAKPFGGRIGPWKSPAWGRSDPHSVGSPENDIDPLTPPRVLPDGGNMIIEQVGRYYPNYSRFPGDQLGLMSQMELTRVYSVTLETTKTLDYPLFDHLVNDVSRDPTVEILAKSPMGSVEKAAIAPDLFDITYYSIESDWRRNYQMRLNSSTAKNLFAPNFLIRGDLDESPSEGGPNPNQDPSIMDHIRFSTNPMFLNPANKYDYIIRDIQHLLTSWIPRAAMDYTADQAMFGKCIGQSTEKVPNPGRCFAGGRTGYSVKLVSREYLMSDQFQLGGANPSAGTLLNPPMSDF